MARYGGEISAASWDSVVFDVPGAATLQRVPMRDPLRGTHAHVGDLLDRSPDAAVAAGRARRLTDVRRRTVGVGTGTVGRWA